MLKLLTILLILSSGCVSAEIKADGKTDDLPSLQEWAKAGNMSINGGTIQNCTFKWSNNLTKTRYEGVTGNLPAAISTKTDL